jgi:hypothetical protein
VRVYESLIWLTVTGPQLGRRRWRRAFTYIEQAKSRSLADLIAFQLASLPASHDNSLVQELRARRKEMIACYHRIDVLKGSGASPPGEGSELRRRAKDHEREIARLIGKLRASDAEFASVQENGVASLEQAQSAIPENACVLEYYLARGRIYVCVITRDSLEIEALGDAEEARVAARLLQYQFGKFRLGREYFEHFGEVLLRATEEHLATLCRVLIAPLRSRLRGRHLIVVPHDFLHQVPFHALMDGGRALIEDFSFSYAPSVSVFQLSQSKPHSPERRSLVMGVPDMYAPEIRREIEAVAASLPQATMFQGAAATIEELRRHGPSSRFIHIATHGLFRQDNPMFSSVRLGNSEVRVFEFYELSLSCDLMALSGCGTGLSTVVAADELLGLVRGLLYAGARTVLASLWDVSDASTARFMETFYAEIREHGDNPRALRAAMILLREQHPHPFYWAPFVLIGAAV